MEAPREKAYWFPAKTYGWGWGLPCAWQGWVVLVTFLALVGGGPLFIPLPRCTGTYFVYIGVLVIALIAVCFAKGEKPGWRWGIK